VSANHCGLGPTYNACERLALDGHDTVLVSGAGPVGLGGVVNATHRGARVLVTEPAPYRADLARELGADAVVDPTDGRGVDAAVECTGLAEARRTALEALRPRGTLAIVGEGGEFPVHGSDDLIRTGNAVLGIWHYPLGQAEDVRTTGSAVPCRSPPAGLRSPAERGGGNVPSRLRNLYPSGDDSPAMTYRIVGANFDQMHMHTDLEWVRDHPDTALVGLCDEDPSTSTASMAEAAEEHGVPASAQYDDLEQCIAECEPDIVVGCPKNSEHADFVERVLARDIHLTIEKPFAASLADADRMLDAAADSEGRLAVNWPVTWSPVHHEARRLVQSGAVGDVLEVGYYGGNAGAPPDDSWFYDADAGGGSLMDYLGYGATFSTWFRGGELPESVSARAYVPDGLEVDVQSTTVARYEDGLSTLQTSWRMFTHPWEHRTHPAKGYDISGTEGALTTRDPDAPISVQTDEGSEVVEPPALSPPEENLIQYVVDRIESDEPFEGPTDPAFCREAQRIIETAQRSIEADGELPLAGEDR
jgi:glucose-fructose oxidoreductase